ncbi:CcdC protein domain-containing protein [Paenibacillus sp. YIM B09110]|uniref:CcdC protein domain-containing protein n=1 Tax=Paenibacillus sp. YIM B09110 TaxID=3126102 RepID=UPI00301CF239
MILVIAVFVLWRRTRAFYRPVLGGKRLLMPLLFMLPGVTLFMNSDVHAPMYDWIIAVVLGIVLSLPLIWTTNYEIRDDNQIYATKNMGFIIAFLAVLAIRFALRGYLDMVNASTLGALFMLVAFSYVLPWRVVSYMKYRKVAGLRA